MGIHIIIKYAFFMHFFQVIHFSLSQSTLIRVQNDDSDCGIYLCNFGVCPTLFVILKARHTFDFFLILKYDLVCDLRYLFG